MAPSSAGRRSASSWYLSRTASIPSVAPSLKVLARARRYSAEDFPEVMTDKMLVSWRRRGKEVISRVVVKSRNNERERVTRLAAFSLRHLESGVMIVEAISEKKERLGFSSWKRRRASE